MGNGLWYVLPALGPDLESSNVTNAASDHPEAEVLYIFDQWFEPSQQACTDQEQGNWRRCQSNSAELVSHLPSTPFS
jgi:hypothetical protein